jgi:hypothetical protein
VTPPPTRSILSISAINVELSIVLKRARCTLDILSQILYDKTEDVGKLSGLFKEPQREVKPYK